MFPNETRVLVILPRDLVDRARALAGRVSADAKLKRARKSARQDEPAPPLPPEPPPWAIDSHFS